MSDVIGPWAIVEVRGGVAELDVSLGVARLHVDWDEIGDSVGAARDVLDALIVGNFRPEDEERIRDAIVEIWPDIADDALEDLRGDKDQLT